MEDKPKITVVVSSKKTVTEGEEFINHVKSTCDSQIKMFFITNDNAIGLSKLYNQLLREVKFETDIVVFCHDDVEYLKKGWDTELVRLFDKHKDYGIIGVAGSAEFDEKAAWWNYSKRYGQVLHRNNGKSWLTAFSPLLDHDLEEVCVIDGLFIALHRKRISKNFDANLDGFNFYDIDFCLANYLDGKTKIGVTTNIRMAHNSVGELSDNWYENKDKIIQKYGDYFPISIKK